jgi:tetratricopeptide (TPR) repeat protein
MAAAWKDELNPRDAESPRAHNEHGDRLRDAGRNQEAEQAYRRAMPRLELLAGKFPDMAAYPQELAASHLGLSFVLRIGGFPEEARQEHDRAMSLYEHVAARFPNASDPRGVLAFGYHDLGKKFGSMKQPAEAELAFRQAVELYEKLVVDFPTNGSYQRLLGASRFMLSESPLRKCQTQKDAAGCLAAATEYEALRRADSEGLYNAACYRAVCAAVIPQDPKTPAADVARLAREQADLAMAWLYKAVASGFKHAEHMKQDPDLDALREREDFKKLLAELPATRK